MDEADVLKLGCACELRGVLADQMNIAERQYRHMMLVARSYELRWLNAKSKFEGADDHLRFIINLGVRDVFAAISGVPDDPHAH